MKYTLISLVAFLILGCATPHDIEQVDENAINVDGKTQTEMITAKLGSFKESDAISILNARIEGNKMYLIVEYSGGCKDHSFELIGSYAIAKSIPPQRSIQLYHNSNQDNCRALLTDTIVANIEALAASSNAGSEIILNLDGYGKQLKYIYE